MLIILGILIALVFLLNNVSAVNCNYNTKPNINFLSPNIKWVCYTNASYCYSYIAYENELIQLNPIPEYVEEYGVVDYFEVKNGIANIKFRNEDLRHNISVTFGVKCDNETLEINVTPQYKELYEVLDWGIWARENTPYLIFAGFVVLIVLILIFTLWGKLREILADLLDVIFRG